MSAEHLFEAIITLGISILGFFIKMMHSKVEKTADELSTFKTYVAMTHPTMESIDKRLDKMDGKLDKLDEKLDEIRAR